MIHDPYFLLRRASRTPRVLAVLILCLMGFGLGEPEASAGASSVAGMASAGPMISSPSALRDIGTQIRRSLEQHGPITPPADAAGVGVALFNRERAAAGLPPLSESPLLDQVATIRAQQMVTDGLTHTRPGSHDFAATQLLRQNAAEAWWMTSPEHRANILGANFRQVGIGTAIDGGKMYIAAVFTDSANAPTPTQPQPQPAGRVR